MEIFQCKMVNYRKIVPQHTVADTIDIGTAHLRDDRSMTHISGKGVITAVNAECIHNTFSGHLQMPYPVVYSIEEPFSVKGTAFEYDGYPKH